MGREGCQPVSPRIEGGRMRGGRLGSWDVGTPARPSSLCIDTNSPALFALAHGTYSSTLRLSFRLFSLVSLKKRKMTPYLPPRKLL